MAPALTKMLRLAAMLAPHGAWILANKFKTAKRSITLDINRIKANSTLQNKFHGKRCFIVGNSPSVGNFDLSLLEDEFVFSVSNGYLHHQYSQMHPKFHCVPQITYGFMKECDVIDWFTEMHQNIGDANLFLSTTEQNLVEKNNLFPGREVYFLSLCEAIADFPNDRIIDISHPAPSVESVPIMSLMIAMYYGFSNIYLLGIDHDSWKTGQYKYAFDLDITADKDSSVDKEGNVLTNNYDTFSSMLRLWGQYRKLKHIAGANNINIFNCGYYGELDEFPRVDFKSLFSVN